MAAPMVQTTAIPRFLLPQLTWGKVALRHPAPAGIFRARYHQSSTSPQQSTSTYLRNRVGLGATRQWQQMLPRFAYASSSNHSYRRNFSATGKQARDHHFDTLKFVQRLKDEGFTEEQAEAMMRVLSDVIEERCVPLRRLEALPEASLTFSPSIQNLTRTMVLREDQEKATYTQKVDFAKLRSELMTADSTESSLTRASHERLTNELAKLNSRLRDEIQRTQASVRLDLNLEKGRIREEANVQELKIKETETRIEQETAQLRERLEAVKFSTLQWLMYDHPSEYIRTSTRTSLTCLQGRLHRHSSAYARCLAFVDVKAGTA